MNHKSKNNNFKFKGIIKNWKNDQQFKIDHIINIKKNGNIEFFLNYKKKYINKIFINFRNVNQSYKWRRQKIVFKDKKFIGKISKNYINNQYPIQYYFELVDNNISFFCPGINKNLSIQPYYVINI